MNLVDSKPYLDHLKMEIQFMGWLALFCLALAAGAADRIILEGKLIAPGAGWLLIVMGLSQVLLAALFFFRQRAGLARLHERLSLRQTHGEEKEVEELLNEADSWACQVYHRWGFCMLGLGLANLGAALLEVVLQPEERSTYLVIGFLSCLALMLALIYMKLTRSIFRNPRYKHLPSPFMAYYHDKGKDFIEIIDYTRSQ